MTYNPIAVSANEMAFVPCDLVTIQVGRTYTSVYPKVKPTMPIHECAHAFQVIKSRLKALPIDTYLILEAIGMQLNHKMRRAQREMTLSRNCELSFI